MENKQPVILIFDVGKTNKKIVLFNKQYSLVYKEFIQLEETKDEDGFRCEDVHALTAWIQQSFQKILLDDRFQIVAVNVSAYGASFVHLNEKLQPFLSLYNYLKSYPGTLLQKFYNGYDTNQNLSVETASPKLGNLNSGLQLYWLKQAKPDSYNLIKASLHLPQYISFILCGKTSTDITSVGCHTMLWNFEKNDYHSWVDEEKIKDKLPPFVPANHVSIIKNNIAVGSGLHDSSAALIPYLENFTKPFILISTGTWSISLNPFDCTPLTNADLDADCLCFLSHKGKRVKASRVFAGNEHEEQTKRLAHYFNKPVHYYKNLSFNVSLCTQSIAKNKQKPLEKQSAAIKQSVFSQRLLSHFNNYEEAYHQLMIDLTEQQVQSTRLIMKSNAISALFVDGGFSKNDLYMNLLAAAFPQFDVYAATVAQASALGAAIAIKDAWNELPLPQNLVELKRFKPAFRIDF